MKEMIKFPSIGQYRNIVKEVQEQTAYQGINEEGEKIFDYSKPMPSIIFTATEKIHGTNACVCYSKQDGLWVQSRNNIITVEKDNSGCAFAVEAKKEIWESLILQLIKYYEIDLDTYGIALYSEFCGGNIQKNSAVSGLDKRFILFRHFKVFNLSEPETSSYWLETNVDISSSPTECCHYKWIEAPEHNIFNISSFPSYEFVIDFNKPEASQNDLIRLVEEVIEPSSPVGVAFGIPNNIGEGIVCSHLTTKNQLLMFKVKGEKHSVSPVKKLKQVDEQFQNKLEECVEKITHDWRFEQGLVEIFGLEYEKTLDRKKIGDYLKWVSQDTLKEELDIISEFGLEPKQVMGMVTKKAKEYFFASEKL